jgi:putative ABC transport system permease protein
MIRNLLKLGWKNIWRNKKRTFLTLFAIAYGITAVVFIKSYIAGVTNNSIEQIVRTQSGHIKIAHSEYLRLERIMPKEYMVANPAVFEQAANEIEGVETVDQRVKFHTLLNFEDANEPAVAVGVDPSIADKTMLLSQTVVAGDYMDDSGKTLIIGKTLADKLGAGVGDELLLVTTDINYSTYALPFKIAGLFETGYSSLDKHVLYIPIAKGREMLDCGNGAHEILVFLKDPEAAPAVAAQLEESNPLKGADSGYRIVPWQKNSVVESFYPFFENIVGKVMGLIMLIVALVILNTMLMAVMERYKEIGIFKALGFKNKEVLGLILMESFYVGLLGSLVGGALGGAISAALEKKGINVTEMLGPGIWDKIDIPVPVFSKILYPDFSISILVGSIVFGILMAMMASLYPAVKSLKMLPVEAFRSELKV